MSKFLSPRLSTLSAYTPGEQPVDGDDGRAPSVIKLNTNESPYPPPKKVIEALSDDEILKLNLYPNPDGDRLVEKLAQTYDVSPDSVIIGNGSDELLAFSFMAFFDRGVAFPDITYGFYPVYAELYDVPYVKIPLKDDLTVDVSDYIGIKKGIVLANPNAPTGIALSLDDIESIISTNPEHLVLIDEAYVDFGAESALSLIGKYGNLLIMHTYSKARSMAGARLAYAIAQPEIINDLLKIKYSFNPYNVNRLTQAAAIAALEQSDYYEKRHNEIISTRAYLTKHMSSLGFILTDSKANFVFAKHPDIKGKELCDELKKRGILVRHWNSPRISDYVRITIGTRAQTDRLVAVVSEILGG